MLVDDLDGRVSVDREDDLQQRLSSEVRAEAVVPISTAYSAAAEFFRKPELPSSADWLEL